MINFTNPTKYNLVPFTEGAYIEGLFGGKIESIKSKETPLFSGLDNLSNNFSSGSDVRLIFLVENGCIN